MSKFRCRQLDASKPIPIYFQEDIYDSSEFNNVTNRSVPQLPTGMEKEEETEHHLQQAIFHHRVIPVPEVYCAESHQDKISFDQLYPPNYKPNRQYVHIHPFSTEQDIPDYDMDSEDEEWLQEHARKGELLPLMPSQFEEMMDRLEKASGLKAVTLQEAKLLLKDDDDLITAVYDYWLNKRLNLQHPLIPQVKSEKCGNSSTTDPYVAFRKRTEKMQTRKNRKNDETSYEKMLKLRRDLARAITLLDMVKRREKNKRELLHFNIEVHEKRYEMEDFNGAILNEINSQRSLLSHRPAFAPIIPNHQLELEDSEAEALANNLWHKVPSRTANKAGKRRDDGRRERRPYKKKKRSIISISNTASGSHLPRSYSTDPYAMASMYSQSGSSMMGVSEDDVASTSHSEAEDETSLDGYFAFKRNALVSYLAPQNYTSDEEADYFPASISRPHEQLIGRCRRRVGRGGRILLDRLPYSESNVDSDGTTSDIKKNERLHFRPSNCLASDSSSEDDLEVDVETVGVGTSPHRTRGAINEVGGVPSSVIICAEVLEGHQAGSVTELSVTLPPVEQDFISNLLEDEVSATTPPLENDFGTSSSSSSICSALKSSKPSDDHCLTSASSITSSGFNASSCASTTTTKSEDSEIKLNLVNSCSNAVSCSGTVSHSNREELSPKWTENCSGTPESPGVTKRALASSFNNLMCAPAKKEDVKKVMNLSSIYIRQPKDSSQVPSGFLLANRNNGNNVSPKVLWANNDAPNNTDDSPIMSNGPKCTKVTPILFHDT